MMRLEDSREAGLLNPSTQYSSLETSIQMSEFDVPMSRRPKSRRRWCAISACILLIALAAIVSTSIVNRKNNGGDDDTKFHNMRNEHKNYAPAPSPEKISRPGNGGATSPPAPAVEDEALEPVASPLPSPSSSPPSAEAPSLPAFGPSAYAPSYDMFQYKVICNKTVDRAVCLKLFASNPNSDKVDLQQWTIMSMEAAEQALNESYVLARGLQKENVGNVALQQCIEVFSDALDQVNISMYIVADMDVHNPGTAGNDVRNSMSAAMTSHDTCQEGIDEVGSFPGSNRITGQQAKHVDTLLSIALTFANDLTALSVDPNHHRRLLEIKSTAAKLILGRRGLISTRFPQSMVHKTPVS